VALQRIGKPKPPSPPKATIPAKAPAAPPPPPIAAPAAAAAAAAAPAAAGGGGGGVEDDDPAALARALKKSGLAEKYSAMLAEHGVETKTGLAAVDDGWLMGTLGLSKMELRKARVIAPASGGGVVSGDGGGAERRGSSNPLHSPEKEDAADASPEPPKPRAVPVRRKAGGMVGSSL